MNKKMRTRDQRVYRSAGKRQDTSRIEDALEMLEESDATNLKEKLFDFTHKYRCDYKSPLGHKLTVIILYIYTWRSRL